MGGCACVGAGVFSPMPPPLFGLYVTWDVYLYNVERRAVDVGKKKKIKDYTLKANSQR